MKRIGLKTASLAIALSTVSLSLVQPALADWRDVVRDSLNGSPGSQFSYNHRTRSLTDLENRADRVARRVQVAYNSRQISRWQYARLNNQVQNVIAQISEMRADNNFNWRDQSRLDGRLTDIRQQLNEIAGRQQPTWY